MNWHRIGKSVRKTTDGLSTKVFGIMKTPKPRYSKASRESEFTGNVYTHVQTEKTLQELEFVRARAFEVIRRLQNC